MPALIVIGDQDAFTTRDDAACMQALTGGRLVWLPGVGHMPNLERPEEFNDVLVKFLSEIRSEERQATSPHCSPMRSS